MSSLVASEDPPKVIKVEIGAGHPDIKHVECRCCGDPAGVERNKFIAHRSRLIGSKYCVTCYMLKCYQWWTRHGRPNPTCENRMRIRREAVDRGDAGC